ncbi:hypothetical protein BKA65DRAFT_483524 [Rhexocercosporidium sp. MPI-PUGE-AT-0058]|nr:hypothetical protein BKA65DRAFT_483524 [Rhexocercosporidium sp. MPI-PUGE-AT-0058]
MQVSKTWLQELQSFAQEFKRENVPPVLQGDVGTGPVQYQVQFSTDEGINEKRLKLLDDAIRFEEYLGNYWIEVEALLVSSAVGNEGPLRWLPAAQRYAIRCELQEMTAKFASSNHLAQGTGLDISCLMEAMRICSKSKDPNPAELSLVAAFVPRTVPLMTANGVVLTNNMDTESKMKELENIVYGYRKQGIKVDAVHDFVFKVIHGSDRKGRSIAHKKEVTNSQPPTEENSKKTESVWAHRLRSSKLKDRALTNDSSYKERTILCWTMRPVPKNVHRTRNVTEPQRQYWYCCIHNQTPEGILLLHQATAPNLHTLDQHILHSSLTEKDLVLFCGAAGYIRRSVARRIAGASSNHAWSSHGLLASAPIINTPDTQAASRSTLEAVSRESRLEVPFTIPAQATESYEWTGSMSDLYHPSEGSIDFDRLIRSYHSNPWDTTNIDNPQAFDTFVENGGVQDGFLAPIVPDNPESFH